MPFSGLSCDQNLGPTASICRVLFLSVSPRLKKFLRQGFGMGGVHEILNVVGVHGFWKDVGDAWLCQALEGNSVHGAAAVAQLNEFPYRGAKLSAQEKWPREGNDAEPSLER